MERSSQLSLLLKFMNKVFHFHSFTQCPKDIKIFKFSSMMNKVTSRKINYLASKLLLSNKLGITQWADTSLTGDSIMEISKFSLKSGANFLELNLYWNSTHQKSKVFSGSFLNFRLFLKIFHILKFNGLKIVDALNPLAFKKTI